MRWLLLLAFFASQAQAADGLAYRDQIENGDVVIDSRPLAECRRASLPGARCLPVGELLGPQRQLPGERDILWLLGTLGLAGDEAVLVVGDHPTGRDFIAGLLYLAGQRQVRILNRAFTPLLAGRSDLVPGRERGIVRSAVFTAPMRDHLWIVDRREIGSGDGEAILAADPYVAISRFARRLAGGGAPVRVGWALTTEQR